MVLDALTADVPSHVAAAAQSRREATRIRCDNAALIYFAGDIAENLGVTADRVLDMLETLPANLLTHAYSPEGLTTLAYGVGGMLNIDGRPPLVASVH